MVPGSVDLGEQSLRKSLASVQTSAPAANSNMRRESGLVSPLDMLCSVAAAEKNRSSPPSPALGVPLEVPMQSLPPPSETLPPVLPALSSSEPKTLPRPLMPGLPSQSRLSSSAPANPSRSILSGSSLPLAPLARFRGPVQQVEEYDDGTQCFHDRFGFDPPDPTRQVQRKPDDSPHFHSNARHQNQATDHPWQQYETLQAHCSQRNLSTGDGALRSYPLPLLNPSSRAVTTTTPVQSSIQRNASAPSLSVGDSRNVPDHRSALLSHTKWQSNLAQGAALSSASWPSAPDSAHVASPRISTLHALRSPTIPVPSRPVSSRLALPVMLSGLPSSAPSEVSLPIHGSSPTRSRSATTSGMSSLKSVAGRAATKASGRRDSYMRFTAEEEAMLLDGVRVYGVGSWKKILNSYRFHWKRTAVDLKDKYRNITRAKLRRINASSSSDLGSNPNECDLSGNALSLPAAAKTPQMLQSPLPTQSVTTAKFVPMSASSRSLNGMSSGTTTATSVEKSWHAKDYHSCDGGG